MSAENVARFEALTASVTRRGGKISPIALQPNLKVRRRSEVATREFGLEGNFRFHQSEKKKPVSGRG